MRESSLSSSPFLALKLSYKLGVSILGKRLGLIASIGLWVFSAVSRNATRLRGEFLGERLGLFFDGERVDIYVKSMKSGQKEEREKRSGERRRTGKGRRGEENEKWEGGKKDDEILCP